MDTTDLIQLVEELGSNIDDLEESLAPILKSNLSHSTSKLPLLDKAKLHVLVTYAIESVLFSSLRLNGVEAKTHPVFQELARVKEYFGKIKSAETVGAKRSTTLDKDAANRFVKHGLAGNEKYDRERAERIAKEKAGAKRKFDEIRVGTHTRFDHAAKKIKASDAEQSATGTENEETASTADEPRPGTANTTDSGIPDLEPIEEDTKAAKRSAKLQRRLERRLARDGADADSGDRQESGDHDAGSNAGEAEERQKAPKSAEDAVQSSLQTSSAGEEEDTPKKKKRKKRKSKAQKLQDEIADEMK